ncbi:MAG: integrating conjugative element protein [Methylococcales bacterium]
MKRKKSRKLAVGVLIAALASGQTLSGPLGSTGNNALYYQIGGASAVYAPAGSIAAGPANVMSSSVELGFGYSCGKFNLNIIQGIINAVKTIVDKILGYIEAAITAALSALPMYILQRVNPGLYDLLQGLIIKAEASLALANTSCEKMEADIKRGKNPYEDFTDMSKMLDWKVEMSTAAGNKTDVLTAKNKIEKQDGENGIPWIGGGRKGGKNTPEIQITRDVIGYGYGLLGGQGSASLAKIWPGKQQAIDAAVEVLGDVYISTNENHNNYTKAGNGLLPMIRSYGKQSFDKLLPLVRGSQTPSVANLQEASSSDLLITEPVVKALRQLPSTEQVIVMNKLAKEVGVSRALEAAVYMRRMLLAGKREPNITHSPAIAHINESVKELDDEINQVLYEVKIHKELVSETATALLEDAGQHQNRGKVQQPEAGYDLKPVTDGATQ